MAPVSRPVERPRLSIWVSPVPEPRSCARWLHRGHSGREHDRATLGLLLLSGPLLRSEVRQPRVLPERHDELRSSHRHAGDLGTVGSVHEHLWVRGWWLGALWGGLESGLGRVGLRPQRLLLRYGSGESSPDGAVGDGERPRLRIVLAGSRRPSSKDAPVSCCQGRYDSAKPIHSSSGPAGDDLLDLRGPPCGSMPVNRSSHSRAAKERPQ